MIDWVAVAALGMAAAAMAKVFWPQRTQSKTTTEVVDGDVLAQFQGVMNRVTDLEVQLTQTRDDLKETRDDLAATRKELSEAIEKLQEMYRLEEYLQAALHAKEKEVDNLRERETALLAQMESNAARLAHLEEECAKRKEAE